MRERQIYLRSISEDRGMVTTTGDAARLRVRQRRVAPRWLAPHNRIKFFPDRQNFGGITTKAAFCWAG